MSNASSQNSDRIIDRAALNRSLGFDPRHYLSTYRDVADHLAGKGLVGPTLQAEALKHFKEHGWKEGRDPNPHFSTRRYLQDNPDVREAGMNPLDHWRSHGLKEVLGGSPDRKAAVAVNGTVLVRQGLGAAAPTPDMEGAGFDLAATGRPGSGTVAIDPGHLNRAGMSFLHAVQDVPAKAGAATLLPAAPSARDIGAAGLALLHGAGDQVWLAGRPGASFASFPPLQPVLDAHAAFPHRPDGATDALPATDGSRTLFGA